MTKPNSCAVHCGSELKTWTGIFWGCCFYHLFSVCTDQALCAGLCGMPRCLLSRFLPYGAGGIWSKLRLYHTSTLDITALLNGAEWTSTSRQSTSCLFCHTSGGVGGMKVLVHSKDDQLSPVFQANGCIMGTSSVPRKPDGWSSHFIVREMWRVEQKVMQRRREETKTADKNPFPGQNSWKGKQCRGANASLLTFMVTAK